MATYLVEEMHNDRAIRSRDRCAQPLPCRIGTDRLKDQQSEGEKDWIRVTDEVRGEVFAYSIGDKDAPRSKATRREKPTRHKPSWSFEVVVDDPNLGPAAGSYR